MEFLNVKLVSCALSFTFTSADEYGQIVSESGRSAQSGFSFPELESDRASTDYYTYWDWLFGTFYSRHPEFDDHNLATALSGCMGLADVAERVGSVDHVRPFIDLALMRQDQTLWSSIASNPTAWVELGRRVHSPQIFAEGVIHIVGRWQNMTDEDKNDMHVHIRELCERKAKEVDFAKEAIEMRILGHYPSSLCKQASDKPGRPTYANDIYMWMALCFFRQWFAQCISDGRNRLNPDGGYAFYRALAQGGSAYLDHETFRDFHKYFPMSSKACNVLETNMGLLKEEVKEFVKDIVKERAHVNSTNHPALAWLTCTVVNKEDLPWKQQDDAEGSSQDALPVLPESPTAPEIPSAAPVVQNGHDTAMALEAGDGIDTPGLVETSFTDGDED